AGTTGTVGQNAAVLRSRSSGTRHGASASAFSLFKLHGPEGVGVILGDSDLITAAHQANYSGGGQVQGHQALAGLHALIDAPLNWAQQSAEVHRLAHLLKQGAVPGIADAVVANVQDLCVVALLTDPVSDQVRSAAGRLGAASFPVGS